MFKHLKIGKRLAIGFAVLVLLIVVTGAFSAQRMGVAQDVVVEITNKEVPAIRDLGRMATMLAEYRVSERGLVASYQDPEKVAEYTGELVAGAKAFDDLSKAYGATITDPQQKALYQQMLAKSALYFDNSRLLIESVKVGDLTPASGAADLRQATADAVAVMLDDKMKVLDEAVAAQQIPARGFPGHKAAHLGCQPQAVAPDRVQAGEIFMLQADQPFHPQRAEGAGRHRHALPAHGVGLHLDREAERAAVHAVAGEQRLPAARHPGRRPQGHGFVEVQGVVPGGVAQQLAPGAVGFLGQVAPAGRAAGHHGAFTR